MGHTKARENTRKKFTRNTHANTTTHNVVHTQNLQSPQRRKAFAPIRCVPQIGGTRLRRVIDAESRCGSAMEGAKNKNVETVLFLSFS